MKKEIEFYVPTGFELIGDVPRSTMCDNDTLLVRYDIKRIDKSEPQQPGPHAELKAQYARDVETCATIDGLEAWQLWQWQESEFNKNGCYWEQLIDAPSWDYQYRRHPHADSMIEYHRCSDEDKLRWQCIWGEKVEWVNVCECKYERDVPIWRENAEYRLKPHTITIVVNGVSNEYNAPLNKLPTQKGHTNFWYLDENYRPKRIRYEELNSEVFECYFRENRIFTKLEDCQAVADAFAEILASAK